MHCASCKVLIENSVKNISGVKDVFVNFATEKMTVSFDDSLTSVGDISHAVSSAGNYKIVSGAEEHHEGHEHDADHMHHEENKK